MNRRSGFTIVEMLMVIAVLAVLMGIVGTAASSAVRNARGRKAEALRSLVQVGIATYHAQKGCWPPENGKLDDLSGRGVEAGKSSIYLDDTDYDKLMTELVTVSMKGRSAVPVIDPTGLIVVDNGSASKPGSSGQEFRQVVKKRKHGSTLQLNKMVFGYQDPATGGFCRFRVRYNGETDSISVERNSPREDELKRKRGAN